MSCNKCREYSKCRKCEYGRKCRCEKNCDRCHEKSCDRCRERSCESEWSPKPCPPCPRPYPPCPRPYPPYPPTPGPTPGPVPGPGGFGPYAVPTAVQIDIFQNAVGNLVGATYTPFIVAVQIVNGTNYLYIAQKAVQTTTGTVYTLVAVKLYQAADSTVRLVSIDPIIIK